MSEVFDKIGTEHSSVIVEKTAEGYKYRCAKCGHATFQLSIEAILFDQQIDITNAVLNAILAMCSETPCALNDWMLDGGLERLYASLETKTVK